MDHRIVALNISVVIQYHAMLVELFIVLVIEHMTRRIGWLPLSPSIPSIRRSGTIATTDFGYAPQVRSAGK